MRRVLKMTTGIAGVAGLAVALAAAPTMAQDGTVTVLRISDADTYDPHRSSALAAAEILYMIGDTLVTLDHDLQTIRPGLAESWEVSDDGLEYTFHLRDGVTFCDGKPLDAHAVVASIERWLDPDTAGVSVWKAGEVADVTAPDDRTVVYTLESPYSELLYQMAQFNFVIIDAEQAAELGDDFGVAAINASGPFCFEAWEPRTRTILTRHEGYDWGPDFTGNPGPAAVERVIWQIVPEEATLVAALQAGEGDASYSVPDWAILQLQADPNISILEPEASFRTNYIGMKITRPLMDDRNVREAISLAIDHEAIAEAIYFGLAEPATAYISEQALDFNPDMNLDAFAFDPERAAALLDEAGWTGAEGAIRSRDGEPLSLVYYGFSDPTSRQIAEAVQGDLRKVGIDLQLELYDATVVWGMLRTQDFDLYQMDYPYLSAGDALNLYFLSENVPSPNRMNWQDPETDRLIAAGNSAVNDAARYAAFAEAGAIVHDAVLWKPLVHMSLRVVAGPRLEPFTPHGVSGAGLYNGLYFRLK